MTQHKKTQLTNKYKYLLSEFESTKDPKLAIQFIEMFLNKSLAVKVAHDGELKFFPKAQWRNKCCRCWSPTNKTKGYINPGDPHFLLDGQNWHVQCASEDEKNHEWYQKWFQEQQPVKLPETKFGEPSWSDDNDDTDSGDSEDELSGRKL